MSTIPQRLDDQLRLALDNFALANLVSQHLCRLASEGVTVIPTKIQLGDTPDGVFIPSANCGLFTTPVLNTAMLNVRKLLEFFCLTFDRETSSLKARSNSKYPDDYSILDIQLPAPTPHQFYAFGLAFLARSPTSLLHDAYTYTNKELAHFTKTQSMPGWSVLSDCSRLMIEAILVLIYDALSIGRPKLQPTSDKKC